MSWLFNRLLRKHARRESGRLQIHRVLQEQVRSEYNEQTIPGNIYNNNIEVIMATPAIQRAVRDGDTEYLNMVKRGLSNSFDEAVKFIETEKIFPTDYE
jgi:hypothetical protein